MPSSEWPDEKAMVAATSAVAMAPGDPEYPRRLARSVLTAAAKASPVIPAPKCETCGGPGRVWGLDGAGRLTKSCPDCHGTGVAEVIPVAVLRDLRAWIAKSQALPALRSQDFEAGRQLAFKAVVGWLDEHTRTKPQTNERTTR